MGRQILAKWLIMMIVTLIVTLMTMMKTMTMMKQTMMTKSVHVTHMYAPAGHSGLQAVVLHVLGAQADWPDGSW